jgi:hypothetical protein
MLKVGSKVLVGRGANVSTYLWGVAVSVVELLPNHMRMGKDAVRVGLPGGDTFWLWESEVEPAGGAIPTPFI